jgi:hypothetical protein
MWPAYHGYNREGEHQGCGERPPETKTHGSLSCSLLFIEHYCSYVVLVNATFQYVVIASDLEQLHFPGCVLATKNIPKRIYFLKKSLKNEILK